MSAGRIVLEPDKSWFRLYLKVGSHQLKWRDIEATAHVTKEGYHLVRVEVNFVSDKAILSVRQDQ